MLLIDGRETDRIPATDRGLSYGDGLFETLAVREGRPEFWDRHLVRLADGCRRLKLPLPEARVLRDEARRLCQGVARGVLKLLLTRGSGGRGYRPPSPASPRRVLSLHSWPDYPAHWWRGGVTIRLCRQRLSLNPDLAGLKHLNRLDQVLARSEWQDPVIAEGLMLDPMERVVEGTMSNLFLVRQGRLFTPLLDRAGVRGVMRGVILDLAAGQGLEPRETDLGLNDLVRADEVFVCNSVIGLWPVRRLETREWSAPGPVTAWLTGAVAKARGECSESW